MGLEDWTKTYNQKSAMQNEAISIYWASGLFDHKELLGNLQLGMEVEAQSSGRYKVTLPQDGEYETGDRDILTIRNVDLLAVVKNDVVVANFDGTELDSGTVVEFCFAKALDIPTVLLRTDFRNCGDSNEVPWNLMCAGWQRTKMLCINSMEEYHSLLAKSGKRSDLANALYRELAGRIIQAVEDVSTQPAWLSYEQAFEHYGRILKSAGSGLENMLTESELKNILEGKHKRGVL